MNPKDVQDRIMDLVDERGMTLYELAGKSGLSLSGMYNIFRRKNYPKIDTLIKICKALDTTLSDFFIFSSEPREGGSITKNDESLLVFSRELNARNMGRLIEYARGLADGQKNPNT